MDEKEEGKNGKWEKVVLGKVLLFLLTVSLPLLFFPMHPPQHMLTLTHHPPHNMTHWCTPSHANMAVCWRC